MPDVEMVPEDGTGNGGSNRATPDEKITSALHELLHDPEVTVDRVKVLLRQHERTADQAISDLMLDAGVDAGCYCCNGCCFIFVVQRRFCAGIVKISNQSQCRLIELRLTQSILYELFQSIVNVIGSASVETRRP